MNRVLGFFLMAVGCLGMPGRTAEVHVAVAANFAETARELAKSYTAASGHEVTLSSGSTGQLFAQIHQGAPYDVFLAADAARPERAIADGLAVPGSAFTYATGRLVLYRAAEGPPLDGAAVLRAGQFHKLALASPKLAPYGAAAREAMTKLGVWEALQDKLVFGQSVAQAMQFVATGNAEFGFVARAQIGPDTPGAVWAVPADLHAPIRQDAVLLRHGEPNPAARGFLEFLRSPAAMERIRAAGYGVATP